jgi:hypothetical protein
VWTLAGAGAVGIGGYVVTRAELLTLVWVLVFGVALSMLVTRLWPGGGV